MMKKLLLFGIIPLTIFGVFVVARAVSADNIDYELYYGNSLDGVEYLSNSYVEIEDKDLIAYNITIPESFEMVAEDSKLELYLESDTLAIAVRVKENGYVYSSYNFDDNFSGKSDSVINPIKSGVTLELYKESTPISSSYLNEREVYDEAGISLGMQKVARSIITPTSNGFIATVDFNHPEFMIKFDLHVSLINGEVVVSIPSDSIFEYNPNIWDSSKQYFILRNIVVFPYFGSTKSEIDGYVVIPDGTGALISLEASPTVKASFSLNVYGEDSGYLSPSFSARTILVKDTSRVTMPIFGMVHNVGNTGFLVVSESGSNYAQLRFKSAGLINDYYNTFFTYRYRESYEQYQSRANEDQYRISFQDEPNKYDMVQKYIFMSGENADYVGLAKAYQDYLLSNDMLGDARRSTYDETPTKVDFVGSEITSGILANKSQIITSYNQVESILSQMIDDGYENLVTSYITYSMGEDSYRFDVLRKLGGKSGLKSMIDFLNENDIEFSYFSDYVRSYDNYSKAHAQTLSKREIYYIELSWMFFAHNVISPRYYEGFAQDDTEDFDDYGIDNIALKGFDRAIFTSYKDGIVSSTESMNGITDALSYFKENDILTNVYLPDSYLFKYVNEYYDAPISSSEYNVQMATIPFLQLAVGGYMDMYAPYLNFVSDETTSLLRLVEYGVFPSYVLSGSSTYKLKVTNSSNIYISEYDVLTNRISDYYSFINEGLTATIGKEMTDHSFIAEGVSLVEYDNSIQIIVNYNTFEVTIGTNVIPAEGYVVLP